jgi:hypothetical protein
MIALMAVLPYIREVASLMACDAFFWLVDD